MKVTEQMITAVRAYAPAPCSKEQARKAAQALLDLIDPVPAGVTEVRDAGGNLWIRRAGDMTTWSRPTGTYSIMDLQRIFGPVTTRDGRAL
jgi:hypothetical protein